MFKGLAHFNKILVTGPQRSGTTICAKMITEDTGHRFVPEEEIGVDSLNRLWDLWRLESGFVAQCPALMRYAHEFGDDDTLIVVVRRPVAEIVASQERIDWQYEPPEKMRYNATHLDGPIAAARYVFWSLHQAARIEHRMEIRYEDLAGHPLWVPAEERENWEARRTA